MPVVHHGGDGMKEQHECSANTQNRNISLIPPDWTGWFREDFGKQIVIVI